MVEERGGGVEAATQGLHLGEAAPPLQTWRLHMRRIEHLVFSSAHVQNSYQLPSSAYVQNRGLPATFLCACSE
jgi:hypothetical protein